MVQRDEDSGNGRRKMDGTDGKKHSPQAFVNQFAIYIKSHGDSGKITVPSKSNGNVSTSYSTPSFDSSSLPSAPSLPHSVPLYFGKLKRCLSLPKSFPFQYSPICADLKTVPSPTSNSCTLREELKRLIKSAVESGSLRRQCASCGNSEHCCGLTILEELEELLSIRPTS